MDLIKEISNTFSKKSHRNFIKFFTRKRPDSSRKDVKVFEELSSYYSNNKLSKLSFKGDPNYHAIRKRITKELINFLNVAKSLSEYLYLVSADISFKFYLYLF